MMCSEASPEGVNWRAVGHRMELKRSGERQDTREADDGEEKQKKTLEKARAKEQDRKL